MGGVVMDINNLSLIATARNKLTAHLRKCNQYIGYELVPYVFDWIMGQMGYSYSDGEYTKEN